MKTKLLCIRATNEYTAQIENYNSRYYNNIISKLCNFDKHMSYQSMARLTIIELPFLSLKAVSTLKHTMQKNYPDIKLYPQGVYYIKEYQGEYLVFTSVDHYLTSDQCYVPGFNSYLMLSSLSRYNIEITVDHGSYSV